MAIKKDLSKKSRKNGDKATGKNLKASRRRPLADDSDPGKGKSSSEAKQHPEHLSAVKKINRVIGQLQGIQRMIEDRRYCADILGQTRAAASALKAIELTILEKHLAMCVSQTFEGTDTAESKKKIGELISLFARI